MNRRSFFRSLGIATAALYLRIAPEAVATVPVRFKESDWIEILDQIMADEINAKVWRLQHRNHPRLGDWIKATAP